MQVGLTAYSRDQERSADMLGASLTTRVYGQSQGAEEFFEKAMTKQLEIGVGIPSFLRSHPQTEERLARIKSTNAGTADVLIPLPDYVKAYASSATTQSATSKDE